MIERYGAIAPLHLGRVERLISGLDEFADVGEFGLTAVSGAADGNGHFGLIGTDDMPGVLKGGDNAFAHMPRRVGIGGR